MKTNQLFAGISGLAIRNWIGKRNWLGQLFDLANERLRRAGLAVRIAKKLRASLQRNMLTDNVLGLAGD